MLEGFLGNKWGDDATEAAARLGLRCAEWTAWEGVQGFEACFDTDHPATVFGRKAFVRLFRSQNRLEGLSLRFMQCGATRDELAEAVRKEFKLEQIEGTLYYVLDDDEVVHLDYNHSDDTCELTIAGPRFGKAFSDYLLKEGFKNLADGLRPR